MTLEGVNKNEGKEGLLVNGKWYNPTERVRPYIAKRRKGETVYMEIDAKGLIQFVGPAERAEGLSAPAQPAKPAQPATPRQVQPGPAPGGISWDDWREKQARDEPVNNHNVRRGGLAHDAAQMICVLQQTGAVRITSKIPADKPEAQKEVLKLTSELHEILLGHLMDNAAEAEKKLRAKLELGSLKPQKTEEKKAGPEAYVG